MTEAAPAEAPMVDCHSHIFAAGQPFVASPRHRPDYAYTAEQYLETLDAHGVRFGVVAAASIFGTYNDYVVESLRRHPRLRATVIVDGTEDRYALERMKADGIVGIRLCWISLADPPDIDSDPYRRLLRRAADLGWHVHLHVGPGRLPGILPFVERSGVKTVIDHLGYPDTRLGLECPTFQAVLRAIDNGRTWVKLSGSYRMGGRGACMPYARALLAAAGPERLVWGSDAPFVSFEGKVDYRQTLDDLAAWVPDPEARRIIGGDTPLRLYFG